MGCKLPPMRKILTAAATLGVVSLAACETTPAGPVNVGFEPAAFGWSTAKGRGAISGQLIYRRGNIAYSCAGGGVVLTPETPWVRHRMMTLYGSADEAVAAAADVRARMPAQSPNYDAYVRRSACGADGRFFFSELPDGAWYVITSATPSVEGPPLAFMRRVVIRNGAAVRVEL